MDSKVFQYVFLIFFAAIVAYTFLLKATFYNEEGLTKDENSVLRIIGENVAGDYALFRLLEKETPIKKAYNNQEQSNYIKETLHIDKKFSSFAAPTKSFVFVPWLALDYISFAQMWWFWGLFIFGIGIYALFPMSKTVFLLFALPAGILTFSSGSWGLYIAGAFLIALTQSENHPKWAGFFAGLCIVEPFCFLCLMVALFLRSDKKAFLCSVITSGIILFFTLIRYGLGSFAESFKVGFTLLYDKPCLFSSFFSSILCSGDSLTIAIVLQVLLGCAVIYGFVRLYRYWTVPYSVKDAYLCSAICLLSPLTILGDYALLSASVLLLLKDVENRGFLKSELAFFILVFMSPFLDSWFLVQFGCSMQVFLSVLALMVASHRTGEKISP